MIVLKNKGGYTRNRFQHEYLLSFVLEYLLSNQKSNTFIVQCNR